MKYFAFDAETNILNRGDGAVGEWQASPFHPDNRIVCYGVGWGKAEEKYWDDYFPLDVPIWLDTAVREPVLLIGHNIGFDLLYALKEWPLAMERAECNLHIWDTQQAEYLLSGQREKYPSLNQCCEKRGWPVKPDKIKEYWKQGIDTALIPKDELLEYQKHDVLTTLRLFHDQWEDIRPNEALYHLVKAKMDDILMTTYMQWYGMKFDLVKAAEKIEALDKEIEQVYSNLLEMAKPHFVEGFAFNPGSGDMVSALLYGGEYKRDESVELRGEDGELLRYKGGQKAGQVKTRIERVVRHTDGFKLKPPKNCPKGKSGFYSTDSEWLGKLKHEFAKEILRYRELTKDVETYYRGYSGLVWHDGCIHPNFNHTATETGRLSSSSPNLQNVTKPDED